MKTLSILLIITICIVIPSFNSQLNAQSWINTNPAEGYFVENNGQYPEVQGSEVLYSARVNDLYVHFTRNGVFYERRVFNTEYEATSPPYDSEYFSMDFVGGQSNVQVIPSRLLSHYRSFIDPDDPNHSLNSSCFEKITYKNVWDNIDIEFVLPQEGGVKYTIIVYPAGNVSDISFSYPLAPSIEILESGDFSLSSTFGPFLDQAPVSYIAGSNLEVQSEFIIDGGLMKFEIANYDTLQPLVIDPWVSLPIPSPMGMSQPYDVDYDDFGNVYIDQYDVITKFDPSGAILWTYSFSPGVRMNHGDIAVKKSTGEVFISNGRAQGSGDLAIWKFNNSGTLINTLIYGSISGPGPTEMWRLRYDNCNDELIIGAGGGPVQGAVIDENFASPLTSIDFAGAGLGSNQNDVATIALDPDGVNCYMLIALGGGGIDNILYKMPVAGLAPTAWQTSSMYTFEELLTNQYVTSGTNGFNGMACGFDYLYSYDGQTIKQWDKTNGTLIAQVASGQVGTLPPGSPPGIPASYGGGIDVDICGNIYAGAGDVINVFDDNLVLIASYPLPNTCYDLIMGQNNKIYACGNNFVTEINNSALAMNLSQTPAECVCDGTALFVTPSGCNTSNFDLLWSPSGQTANSATGLCPGLHTLTVSAGCLSNIYFSESIFVDSIPCALPVELGSFSFDCTPKRTLRWSTLSENNNDFFTIEKSCDVLSFEVIGKINGAGTSLQPNYYEFVDYTDHCSSETHNYYRLIQTDYDGLEKEQGIISSSDCHTNEISLYVDKGSFLRVEDGTPNSISIFDMSGRIVEAKTEFSSIHKIDVSDFPQAIYTVRIHYLNGNVINRKICIL